MSARILIVEDDDLSESLFRHVLEPRGHRVTSAGSVAEARALLVAEPPDLVLLDMQIPGGGGAVLLRDLRQRAGWESVPVVAVTGYPPSGNVERLAEAGLNGYIRKPINTRTFGGLVEEFLGAPQPGAPQPGAPQPGAPQPAAPQASGSSGSSGSS